MQNCYLVIVTRNKWHDYELITDLPALSGRRDVDLRKRIRSFFPLDYADKDITSSNRLIDEGIHLQMWCGRISAFNLRDIPYSDQIGRPIKLGVGVLQELDANYSFQRYSLADINGLIAPLVAVYQSDRNHEPILCDLIESDVCGTLSYCKIPAADAAAEAMPSVSAQDFSHSLCPAEEQSENPDECADAPPIAESDSDSPVESDGLLYLVRQSLVMRDLLARNRVESRSRNVRHFMRACTKSDLFYDPEKVIQLDRKRAYKILVDSWSMPPQKKIQLVKLINPFWEPPAHVIVAQKRAILHRQLGNLAIFIDGEASPSDIEDSFERIADTIHSHLIGMHDY